MPRPGPSVTSGADLQPGSDSLFPSGFTGGGARPAAGSVGTGEIADASVAAADLNLSSVATALAGRPEFSGTYAQFPAGMSFVAGASPVNARRATLNLGAATGTSAAAAQDWCQRIPFALPVKTTRWRLRIANAVSTTGVAWTQPFTLTSVYFGTPATTAGSNRPASSFTATPTQAIAGPLSVPTDGTDLVTGWVTDSSLQFSPHTLGMLSMGFTAPNSGTGVVTTFMNACWRLTTNGTASVGSTALGGSTPGPSIMDCRVEYEFAGSNLIGMYVGDSITEGAGDGDAGASNKLTMGHEGWPGAFGLAAGVPWINMGISGASTTAFTSPSARPWARFDLSTCVPDFAVVSIGSNDAAASTAAATIETNIGTIVANIRALGVKRVYLGTIIPRNFTGATAPETARTAVNAYLGQLPFGAFGCFDFDRILRSPSNALVCESDAISADNTHPLRLGYQRMASMVNVGAIGL